jgi:Bacterial Ig-like domain (group 3)
VGHRSVTGVTRLVLVGLVCILVPSAVARADFTWSGAGPKPGDWSVGANWAGTAPTAGTDAGTLTFPSLPGCSSTACYGSDNNVSNLRVDAIKIDDTDAYDVTGNGFSLGAGGITAGSSSSDTGNVATLDVPLTLSASQTWAVNGPLGIEGLDFTNTVTAATQSGTAADSVAVDFGASGAVQFDSDAEVGPFSATGQGGTISLYGAAPKLNSTDGQTVTLSNGVDLDVQSANASTGPLAAYSADITDGYGNSPDGMLTVDGTASLDSFSHLNAFAEPTASGDSASRLIATGDVSLAGDLNLADGFGPGNTCALTPGETLTLVSTTGTASISGTFANAGAQPLAMSSASNCSPAPEARINYTSNAVTATIVTPTSTALAASPSPAATNEPVTLTATIAPTAAVAAPSGTEGTVAFDNNGVPIPGCAAQPVAIGGAGFVASCATTFAPGLQSLTASYTGGAGYLTSSTSSPTTLGVGRDATSTGIGASNPSPQAGAPMTLTAAVSPAVAGPIAPTGTVEFTEDGAPISGCAAEQLGSPGTASCSTSFAAGTHSVTAVYSGDQSFFGSTSAVQLVTAGAPPSSTPPPPVASPSATTSPATSITTTSATLRGIVNTAGAAVSWQFELGRGAGYGKATAIETLGSGRGSVPVSATIKGLAPGLAYRFVLVVMQASPATTVFGSPLSFTTRPSGALVMTAGRLVVRRGTVRVSESCTSAKACAGRLLITVAGRSCVAVPYHVKAHKRATFTGPLAGSCLKRLRAARGHRLAATFSTTPRTGQLPLHRTVVLALA